MPALLAVWCTVTMPRPAMSPSSDPGDAQRREIRRRPPRQPSGSARTAPRRRGARPATGPSGRGPAGWSRRASRWPGRGRTWYVHGSTRTAGRRPHRSDRTARVARHVDGRREVGARPAGCCGMPEYGLLRHGSAGIGGGVSSGRPLGASAGSTPSSRLRPHLRRRGERPASRLKPFITSAKVGSEGCRRSSSGPELIGHHLPPADRGCRGYRVSANACGQRRRTSPAAPRGAPG